MPGHSETQKKRLILCAALILCSLSGQGASLANFVSQASRRAHRHAKLANVMEEILPDVEIVEVLLDKSTKKEDLARSRDGRYEAFTSQSEEVRIYFLKRSTGKVYEVRGLPLPERPFSDLTWVNNHTLVFDRWSQPHYGIHYVINVRRRKLVSAFAFPDKFYLEQQAPKALRKKQ